MDASVEGAALAVPEVTPPERLQVLRGADAPAAGPVVYWMQQAQRSRDNPALEHALALAARWDRPVCVVFGLDADYPGGTERAFVFMLEGLRDVRDALRERGIGFACRLGAPHSVALEAAQGAAVVVCDRGYLRHQRAWRQAVARSAPCGVVEVEGEVVVPVALASDKAEYAARTLRPRLWRQVERFAAPPPRVHVPRSWDPETAPPGPAEDVSSELDRPSALALRLQVDRSAGSVSDWFKGGERAAAAALERFCARGLQRYADLRNQPHTDAVSYLGMHLHFGQVSPVRALREVRHVQGVDERSLEAFVEELLVRRELAVNHAWYVPDYDRYQGLPDWARATLAEHAADPREHRYDAEALEAGATHDPYWNAAMREMRETGYMHNYMRMYWGKQILAWSADPEEAFERTRALDDRYFLDGRDPNAYAGVAWVFGRHDRPWPERPVFGKVRSMVAAGLRRKTDPEAYVAKIERRVAARSLEHDDA